MLTRMRILLLLTVSVLFAARSDAQSIDYLRHKKMFYLCSFKLDCSGCYDCNMQKYTLRIKNRVEKQIKSISYVYYSRSQNKVVEKQGRIVGDVIDYNQVALVDVCLPNGRNWAISELVYEDDTKVDFVVKDRLSRFYQEADECDCNKRTVLPNPNYND